jgi:hypothetical protein
MRRDTSLEVGSSARRKNQRLEINLLAMDAAPHGFRALAIAIPHRMADLGSESTGHHGVSRHFRFVKSSYGSQRLTSFIRNAPVDDMKP